MGADGNVALTVVKKGASEGETQVDGVTGATLTSKGVGEMVLTGIQQYVDALGGAKPAGCQKAEGNCCKKADCCKEQADCSKEQADCCKEKADCCKE